MLHGCKLYDESNMIILSDGTFYSIGYESVNIAEGESLTPKQIKMFKSVEHLIKGAYPVEFVYSKEYNYYVYAAIGYPSIIEDKNGFYEKDGRKYIFAGYTDELEDLIQKLELVLGDHDLDFY